MGQELIRGYKMETERCTQVHEEDVRERRERESQ